MEQVKSIKALLDAAKPFMAALPEGSAMAKIVAAYVDAERMVANGLERNDSAYFDMAGSVAIVHGDEVVEYYAGLLADCELLPKPSVDACDGCEND